MATFKQKMEHEFITRTGVVDSPSVFSHGWPLTADAFEDQMNFLTSRGYRVITQGPMFPKECANPSGFRE